MKAVLFVLCLSSFAQAVEYSVDDAQALNTKLVHELKFNRCLAQWQGWLLRKGERDRVTLVVGSIAHCRSIMDQWDKYFNEGRAADTLDGTMAQQANWTLNNILGWQ